MIQLDKKTIEKILNVKIGSPDFSIMGVATDSREVKPGNLFVTWQGEQFDGHQFCQQAVEQGAAALLVNKPLNLAVPQIIVEDTIKAFGLLANFWRDQFTLPVIGVTGSNGKTTVKNMLAAIFQQAYGDNYLAPKKSFNNHIGVPLTLSLLTKHQRCAVIEMGMNHFGELRYITQLAKPTVTVITNAGPSHLAGVGSIEGVAKAKGEIMEGLAEEGIAVLNADDDYFPYWSGLAGKRQILSFGLNKPADITAKQLSVTTQGSQFQLVTPQGEIVISLPLLGEHNVMNALAATAAALAVGLDLTVIKQGLAVVEPENRRLQLKPAINEAVLIDDSYNANPNSMRRAIDVLKQFPGRRILAIGDMRELGVDEKRFHHEVGEYAKQAGIDELYAVGDLMVETVNGFGESGHHFANKNAMCDAIKAKLGKNCTVLVKSSLSMGFDEVVTQLTQ